MSRGELVEIGGAFRIPDVLTSQGARLVEVGTTNRTRANDYERALNSGTDDVGMVLSVHRSNYRISGFTENVSVHELAAITKARNIPLVVDTGSGLLDARLPWLADASGRVPSLPWLNSEPASSQTLASGADLIVFSGDKLLGGPQAGVIVGQRALVEQCAGHPLARALRPGGTILDELQQVCGLYLDGRARELPFWELATRTVDDLKRRADRIAAAVGSPLVSVVRCTSVPGGGTLPDAEIQSVGIQMAGNRMAQLRGHVPPIIGRLHEGDSLLDLRTVDPLDDELLIDVLRELVGFVGISSSSNVSD